MTVDAVGLVCGCGHSGTSLIANMLAAHPEVYMPHEETNTFLASEEEATVAFAKLRAAAELEGKRCLMEKTPRHIRFLSRIRRIVPTARFVVPVRDGRDVAASIARRRGDGDAAPGVKRWIRDNAIVARERTSPDVLVYRHEDLVADPRVTLGAICRFIGVPFREELLQYHEQKRLWFGQSDVRPGSGVGDEHNALRNWQVNQPIFDSGGKWKLELEEKDLEPLMKGIGRELMEEFGYLSADRSTQRAWPSRSDFTRPSNERRRG